MPGKDGQGAHRPALKHSSTLIKFSNIHPLPAGQMSVTGGGGQYLLLIAALTGAGTDTVRLGRGRFQVGLVIAG